MYWNILQLKIYYNNSGCVFIGLGALSHLKFWGFMLGLGSLRKSSTELLLNFPQLVRGIIRTTVINFGTRKAKTKVAQKWNKYVYFTSM